MKFILISFFFFVILISNTLKAETYVCSFKCYVGDDICTVKYQRSGNFFYSDQNIFTFEEDINTLILTSMKLHTKSVLTLIVDKNTMKHVKSVSQYPENIDFRDGSCVIVD